MKKALIIIFILSSLSIYSEQYSMDWKALGKVLQLYRQKKYTTCLQLLEKLEKENKVHPCEIKVIRAWIFAATGKRKKALHLIKEIYKDPSGLFIHKANAAFQELEILKWQGVVPNKYLTNFENKYLSKLGKTHWIYNEFIKLFGKLDTSHFIKLSKKDKQSAIKANFNTHMLKQLLYYAQYSNTDSLIILKDGKEVVKWIFKGKERYIETMSVTKSIVSIAVGFMVEERKLSLDTPLYTWYPKWNTGRKKKITLRMILNHTSGIDAELVTHKIRKSGSYVQYALEAEISKEPGTYFRYNNRAVNLLPDIIYKVTGQNITHYLQKKLFTPLGIQDFKWLQDKQGNFQGMAGFQAKATDLAKIGQFMLQNGKWNGKKLLSKKWIDISFKAGQKIYPRCGLLWWRRIHNGVRGYYASGYLGQSIYIIPKYKIVAVRQISYSSFKRNKDNFRNFKSLVDKLNMTSSIKK